MDEIKPVVFWECPLCTHLYLVRVSECDCQPGAKTFRKVKLYDQQAIDTLRAEVEAHKLNIDIIKDCAAGSLNMGRGLISEYAARAERAEAEAEALRKDAERYRWLCDGNGYFMEENYLCGHENDKERADLMIDIEIQAGQ